MKTILFLISLLAQIFYPAPISGTIREDMAVASPTPSPEKKQETLGATGAVMYSQVNDVRTAHGLYTLIPHSKLVYSARIRACEVYNSGKWSHERPNGTQYYTAFTWWEGRRVGENLARKYSSNTQVIDAWMNSDGHRANLLSTEYNYFGYSVCGNVWVIHFAE